MSRRAFLKTRYKAEPDGQDAGDHWIGGKPLHRDAKCPYCKSDFRLLWDINARDARFPKGKFGPLSRLPLYFCWGCVRDIAYQLGGADQLKTFRMDRRKGPRPHFTYDPYPDHFPRRPLGLDFGIPEEVHAALALHEPAKFVPKRAKKKLEPWLGHPVLTWGDVYHSQFGGQPGNSHWASEKPRCPNPRCPDRAADGRGHPMSFLAGVLDDPNRGLPMAHPVGSDGWGPFFVTVQFHICGQCWTLHACNRCD